MEGHSSNGIENFIIWSECSNSFVSTQEGIYSFDASFVTNQSIKMSPSKPENTLGFKMEEITWWTIAHPFEYAQMLMRIGYEPIHPSPENFFGTTYLALPSIFRYVRHIRSVDGLTGCFRGLVPMLCQRIVNNTIQKQIEDQNPWETEFVGKIPHRQHRKPLAFNIKSPPAFFEVAKATYWKMVAVSIGTVVSHPFYLISIRMMAQFVGRETTYSSIWGSVVSIIQEDGIFGLFKGLVPRLVSENLKILLPASIFFVLTRTISNRHIVNTSVSVIKFMTERFTYQIDVVATTMAIENSTMAIGQAPFITKKFSGWLECWSHLYKLNIHNRGRYWIFRYYNGPTVSINGEVRPAGVYLGPFHPRSITGPKRLPTVEF